jgi:Xaa-Pro dipeptidase
MRQDRLERVRGRLSELGIDLLVLPPGEDFLYLAGFSPMRDERACFLLVFPERTALLVPRLNADQVACHLDVPLFTYDDAEGPAGALREALRVVPQAVVAVGDDMRADHLLLLQGELPGARFVVASTVLVPLRMRKDPDELDALRRSAATADAGVLGAVQACWPGATERDVATRAAQAIHRAGAALFTLVASGPHSAFPHHETTDRALQRGEPVLLDLGARVDGYCSDITRMVFLGEPTARYREIHGVVEEAVRAALGTIRPGVPIAEVDRAARRVIAQAGYADRFVHRTGHGLGLSPHEPPSVTHTNLLPLEEGMVFTVEPGIYLPGEFGVRLEEAVVIHEEGPEILSRLARDPIVVP